MKKFLTVFQTLEGETKLLFKLRSETPFLKLSEAEDCPERVAVEVPKTCVRLVVSRTSLPAVEALMMKYKQSMKEDYFVWVLEEEDQTKHISSVGQEGFNLAFTTCSGDDRAPQISERCSCRISEFLNGTVYFDSISNVSCKNMKKAAEVEFEKKPNSPSSNTSTEVKNLDNQDGDLGTLDDTGEDNRTAKNDPKTNPKEVPAQESHTQIRSNDLRSIDSAINIVKTAKIDALVPNLEDSSLDESIKEAVQILLHAGMKKADGEIYPPSFVLAWHNIRLAALRHFEHVSVGQERLKDRSGESGAFELFAAQFGLISFAPSKALQGVLTSLRSPKLSVEKINLWVDDHLRPISLTAMQRHLKMIQGD